VASREMSGTEREQGMAAKKGAREAASMLPRNGAASACCA
jgi:hypothetical protein